MSVPYTKTVRVAAEGGEANAIELPAPTNGVINRLSIVQIGAAEAFTARLFTSEVPAGAADSLSDVDDEEGLPAESFACTPELAGVSGKYEKYEAQWGYNSNEFAAPGRRQSSLWLKLTPAAAGEKVFTVSYTVLMPEL